MEDVIIYNAGFPQHKYMGKILRKRFGKPVCMTVLWEWTQDQMHLGDAEREEIGTVYSLPDFYKLEISRVRKMRFSELDELQRTLESDFGITNNTQLVSHDRNFRKIRTYRDLRNIQVVNLLLAKKIFDENSPILMLGERITYFGNILGEACRARGIPEVFVFATIGSTERLAAFDRLQQPFAIRDTFRRLRSGEETVSWEVAEEADRWLESFLCAPVKPPVAAGVEKSRMAQKLPSLSGFFRVFKQYREYISYRYDRETGVLDNPFRELWSLPKRKIRTWSAQRKSYLVCEPDLGRKFFYVPLHYEPEMSTLYFGSEYEHIERFIKQLSKKIPSDHMVYVKEHPSMLNMRPPSLYKALDSVYNVSVLHPSINTFDLIKNCSAVVTATSTAGWEAFLLGKPVVVLGNVFYNWFPGVHKTSLSDVCFAEKLLDYLEKYEPDEEIRRDVVRAVFMRARHCKVPSDANLGISVQTPESQAVAFYEKYADFFYETFMSLENLVPQAPLS